MIGKKVYGSGPTPCRVLLCGEGPGLQESIQGKPFVGASGLELEYLYLLRAAGLKRKDIYITNLIKWRTDEEDSDPSVLDIERDEEELKIEIEQIVRPEIIVAVGRIAAAWFLQSSDVDMEREHGVPQWCYNCPSCGKRGRINAYKGNDNFVPVTIRKENDIRQSGQVLDMDGKAEWTGLPSDLARGEAESSPQTIVADAHRANTRQSDGRPSLLHTVVSESDAYGTRASGREYSSGSGEKSENSLQVGSSLYGDEHLRVEETQRQKLSGMYENPGTCPSCGSPSKVFALIVAYHPAAGLHAPERYIDKIYWDFQQLGRLVRGEIACLPPPRAIHYSDATAETELPLPAEVAEIGVDTEGTIADPWGLSACAEEGRAFVLRGAKDSPAKRLLRDVLANVQSVVAHNLLHDLDVLRALQAPVSPIRCDDTMLEAYLLPWLPKRLKALSFKLCNIEQEEYVDVIAPAEAKITEGYLTGILQNVCPKCRGCGEVNSSYKRKQYTAAGNERFRKSKCVSCNGDGTAWPTPNPQLVFDDDSVGRVYQPRSAGRSVRALLKRGTGLRDGWFAFDEKVRQHIEGKLGGMREPTLDDVPLDKAIHYSAADATATLQVHHKLKPILQQEGLWRIYEIDKGIIPIIHRMHSNGIRIDGTYFAELGRRFSTEQSSIMGELQSLVGHPVNPASPLQAAKVIYDDLGCKPVRGKRSTDEKTLEALKIKHSGKPIVCKAVDLITDYRELAKLDGTYVRPLISCADADSRVHTQFLLHVTATGRLSSRDPNLQNIPTRTERGRLIRRGFIPRDGCRLVSVDLDQIELRVAAHLSQDEGLINVFNTGQDIHRATAALIYGRSIEDVTIQERLLAKTINFLILYGGGANRLHSELALLGIQTTVDQCVGYINDWFGAYPGVRDYIERCHRQAKASGYVECLYGRRRYVWGVHSCIDKIREESFKWATNFPIQATAAALLKIWMRMVQEKVLPAVASQGHCQPLLTIHDELIFECMEGLQDELIQRVIHEAEQSAQLLVQIKAKGTSAYNWSDLK